MNIEKEQIQLLNELSLAIFGVKSRWKKFLDGVPELVTREIEEEVPAEFDTVKNEDGTESQVETKPAEKRKIRVPKLLPSGAQHKEIRRYSVEEVVDMFSKMKVQVDSFKAQMEQKQLEAKIKQEAQEAQKKAEDAVRETAYGSAVR